MSCSKFILLIRDGLLIVRSKVTCGVSSRYGETGSVWRTAFTACVVLWSRVKHMENSEVMRLIHVGCFSKTKKTSHEKSLILLVLGWPLCSVLKPNLPLEPTCYLFSRLNLHKLTYASQ